MSNLYKSEQKFNVLDTRGSTIEITLNVDYKDGLWDYVILDADYRNNEIIHKRYGIKTTPTRISTTGKIYSDLIKAYSMDVNKEHLAKVLSLAQEEIEGKIANAREHAEQEKQNKLIRLFNSGEEVYNDFRNRSINVPQYIASFSNWLVAGEEANVIKLLLAIMNTAKGEATNIISESSSASGKSHIEDVAFSLVHDRHYVILNYSSTAAFRNQALIDPYMFQHKTVRLGDLGSEINQEVLQEVLGILKVLNTEGEYHSSKMHENNKDILEFTLYGKTAMSYSKVANNKDISDQESSRGIIYTPNPTTDLEYEKFALWKNTPDYSNNYSEMVDNTITNIRNYIDYLIQIDIDVVNPYQKQISKILYNNKTYRRTLLKELWLLKSIALLNLPNKKIYNNNGRNTIFVSAEDIVNYISLYKRDLRANSHFNVNQKHMDFYTVLEQDYIKLSRRDSAKIFGEEVINTGHDEFHEYLFEDNKYFFTLNGIMNKYRGRKELTNIISEVKDGRRKIRDVFNNMVNLIDHVRVGDEYFKESGQYRPNVYYLVDIRDIGILDQIRIDKDTLKLFIKQGHRDLISDIVADFKRMAQKGELFKDGEELILKINPDMSNVLDFHPDIPKPPTLEIDKEIEKEVEQIWDEYFGDIPDLKEDDDKPKKLSNLQKQKEIK